MSASEHIFPSPLLVYFLLYFKASPNWVLLLGYQRFLATKRLKYIVPPPRPSSRRLLSPHSRWLARSLNWRSPHPRSLHQRGRAGPERSACTTAVVSPFYKFKMPIYLTLNKARDAYFVRIGQLCRSHGDSLNQKLKRERSR
jgi:hypothetical protein